MKIIPYEKKGKKLYKFQIYIGKDPLTGKEIRTRRSGFKTKKEAETEYLKIRTGMDEKDTKIITFKDTYESWLSQHKLKVKATTLKNVESHFDLHIIPAIGNYNIKNIRLIHIQNFINDNYLKFKDNRFLKYRISQVFIHAIKLGYVTTNPAELAEVPTSTRANYTPNNNVFWDKKTLLAFLTRAEIDMKNVYYTFFYLLAFTGLRRGEALALHWEDIDFTNGKLSISRNLTLDKKITTPKTKSSIRIITIDSETIKVLKRWRMLQKTSFSNPIVFTDTQGNYITLSTPIKHLNKLVDKMNIPRITIHGFRHTHCSLLFESGASIKEVQDRLGHGDIKTTMNIYAHVTKGKKKEVADNFKDFMFSS